jgi:hypothetical protein
MTPEQIALVQSSFERVGPDLPDLATRFYQELFGQNPSLRPMFTTDLASRRSGSPRSSPRSCGPSRARRNFSGIPALSEPGTSATGCG